ncbi:DUF1254 domain-containing protein [Mesorhizobium sp. LHD-90]|uniref:DUF1254 domain-containing protein n=1 Tax=Mesorhizobium sp. LHD-90 TaxID=3071414 RepID=UPI0027E198FA|nr:DUF1254 domain-containing protein [Mesorhizobium sp. LHD-90]MDQ6437946.1 DUF1254 domain-containing protein [Mesorhizobium sp. LHD-90]
MTAFDLAVSPNGGTAYAQTPTTVATNDWREEYAYTLGVQAYVYAFPLTYLSKLRYEWTNVPDSSFYASLNHFHHKKVLANHINYTSGGSPNQDTLYSWGWLDLRQGPVALTHPDMGDRYFTFEIADMFSDNFAYVGKRTTGGAAGAFAILPPGWSGSLPPDIKSSFQSPTRFALVFGRTLVNDEADVAAVNKLQDQYRMIPLALWGQLDPQIPEGRDVFKPYDTANDPLGDWRTINRAWAENPLPKDRDADLVRLFGEIGIGPAFTAESIDKLPEPTRQGLARAAATARPMLNAMLATGAYKSKMVNDWMYPPKTFGSAGLYGDFIVRAAGQCLGGIISNDPDEAVYLFTFSDVQGQPLVGGRRYSMQFKADNLPPVNEFWSVTMYGPDNNFVPTDTMRYAIGDRTAGLTKGADGSLTIYIQPDAPSDPSERANWLPSPAQGAFHLALRTYVPKQPIIDQVWVPPAVTPA